jgi:hypothetical protein
MGEFLDRVKELEDMGLPDRHVFSSPDSVSLI